VSVTDQQAEAARTLFRSAHIVSLATQSGGEPNCCTVFTVPTSATTLAFKSRRASRHMSAILGGSANVAVSLFDPLSTYHSKKGLQLRGSVRDISGMDEMRRTVDAYGERFPGSAAKLPPISTLCERDCASTFFLFVAEAFRLTLETPDANLSMPVFIDAEYLA